MAYEVFIDTSGFYAQWDRNDRAHEKVKAWLGQNQGKFIPVTTEWVIGETCTLLMARRAPHLIATFLDQLAASRVYYVRSIPMYRSKLCDDRIGRKIGQISPA